jgi:predicted dehydrogenase
VSSPRPVQVAVLGTGAVAQVVHLPILRQMAGADVRGVYDLDGSKSATLASRFEIPRSYRAEEEVWSDPEVDAVVICTPSHLHEEQVIRGLDAGKYVFCEKPLALTAEGCHHVVEHATAGRLMVGMNQRFRPDAFALKKLVSAGQLGEIQYLRTSWLNRRPGRSHRTWRQQKESAGGGALMDLGLQMLDLSLWILGYPQPKRVVAHLRAIARGEVEDTAILLLELASGAAVNLDVTWSLLADRERQYLQVIGSEGSGYFAPLKVFRDSENGLQNVTPAPRELEENPFTASYREELAQFVAAVQQGDSIPPPTEHVVLMRILEAAYRSAEAGAEIRF